MDRPRSGALAGPLLALGLLAGCGQTGEPSLPDAAELELGTGLEDGVTFAPLAPAQRVPLTFGVQQGFHVWTNLRLRNVAPTQLKMRRTAILTTSGEVISTNVEQLNLVPAIDPQLFATGWLQLPSSLPTFLCPNALGHSIPEQRVTLQVEVTDRNGKMARAEQVVVPFCPPNRVESTCRRQCAPGSMDGGTDGP